MPKGGSTKVAAWQPLQKTWAFDHGKASSTCLTDIWHNPMIIDYAQMPAIVTRPICKTNKKIASLLWTVPGLNLGERHQHFSFFLSSVPVATQTESINCSNSFSINRFKESFCIWTLIACHVKQALMTKCLIMQIIIGALYRIPQINWTHSNWMLFINGETTS